MIEPLPTADATSEPLSVVVFSGIANLPLYAAQAKGFFAKRGLNVDLKFTPNSKEQRSGLAEGRYNILQSAIDNAFALKDKANVDVVVVYGGDNSFNRLLVQPGINSLADIKGKTVVVDAIDTAFAFQLYEMLRQKGVNKGEYDVKPLGGSPARLAEMIKDKSLAAAMLSPPYSIKAVKAGLKDMGSAATALGAYQGSSIIVSRAWAAANSSTLIRFLQAAIEGSRWALDPQNQREVVDLLMQKLNLPEDIATLSYESTKDDFSRDGAIDLAGIENVLNLRAEFEGKAPAAKERYLDLSYYEKALAGL